MSGCIHNPRSTKTKKASTSEHIHIPRPANETICANHRHVLSGIIHYKKIGGGKYFVSKMMIFLSTLDTK